MMVVTLGQQYNTGEKLAVMLYKLHNGFMVYHFSTTFKEISFCTQVLDLLWKENFIRGYIKTNDES